MPQIDLHVIRPSSLSTLVSATTTMQSRVALCPYDVTYSPNPIQRSDKRAPRINLSLKELQARARAAGVEEREVNMAFSKQELIDMIQALDGTLSTEHQPLATAASELQTPISRVIGRDTAEECSTVIAAVTGRAEKCSTGGGVTPTWRDSSLGGFRVHIVFEDGRTKRGKVTPDIDVYTVIRRIALEPSYGLSLDMGGTALEQTSVLSELGVVAGTQLYVVPLSAPSQVAPAELYLENLFEIADVNNDGVLSPGEFSELLSRSGFNFPDDVITALVKAADANADGVIQYEEFVPTILGLMQAANEEDLADVGEDPPDDMLCVPMWDEVSAEKLEYHLKKLFPK